MKDGDVYFWRWKNEERHNDCGPFRSYHCFSRIAIAKGGTLYDTYWCDMSHSLNKDDVIATLQGNINEMTKITVPTYYRREDIVDMRHANNTRDEIYLKVGAKRNSQVMREHIAYQIEKSESEIKIAENRIEKLRADLETIESGQINDVYF